jgi:hypothetical protein
MVAFEASEFGYTNAIYAGDLFVTKDGHHKQRDFVYIHKFVYVYRTIMKCIYFQVDLVIVVNMIKKMIISNLIFLFIQNGLLILIVMDKNRNYLEVNIGIK